MVAGGVSSDLRLPKALLVAVSYLDRWLRWWHRVEEFTADTDCLIRVAWREAGEALLLPDGTAIRAGAAVGELHFWNEHLPPFGSGGPSIGWARMMHGRAQHSLRLLAQQVRHLPERRQVVAFYADVPISRRRSEAALRRLARRYGFECPPDRSRVGGVMHDMAYSILAWGLVASHNPIGLRRRAFLRRRRRIWISRTTLLERYAPAGNIERFAAA
jgi:hypothetical protein